MPRLTRAQSQAHTRDVLVATARRLFLAEGFAAVSVDRVAEESGFSKGAVYSNFRTKDDLGLAVVDAVRAGHAADVAGAAAGAGTLAQRLAAFDAWAERTLGDEAWIALEVELALRARHDPHLRAELAARSTAVRGLVAALVAADADRFGVALPMPAADAALALVSLGVGLGVQRALDPDVPVRALTDTVRALLGPPPSR